MNTSFSAMKKAIVISEPLSRRQIIIVVLGVKTQRPKTFHAWGVLFAPVSYGRSSVLRSYSLWKLLAPCP